MSKVGYFLIGVIGAALLYMGAARLFEWNQRRLETQNERLQNDGEPFSFQHVPISLAAPQAELMQDPIKYQPQFPVIYLEDAPLSDLQQQEQARVTVKSIVADFQDTPEMMKFNQDLQQLSGGNVQGLADLSTGNLEQILQENPQISHVVEKHLKNPNFSKMVEDIFNNPQFQESVQELQGPGTPASVGSSKR